MPATSANNFTLSHNLDYIAPKEADFKTTHEFITSFVSLESGCFDDGLKVSVRGLVIEKTDKSRNFKMYKIADPKSKTGVVRVICPISEFVSVDGVTFNEMHSDVEVGDTVKVVGYPSRSYKGNMCVYCSKIFVKSYGNNQYDTNDDFINDGPLDYINQESGCLENDSCDKDYFETEDYEPESDLDDDETFDNNVVPEEDEEESDEETDMEESETESEASDESDFETERFFEDNPNYYIVSVPLRIYANHVLYNKTLLTIRSIFVDTPGKLVFDTNYGEGKKLMFSVTRLAKGYLGITMPANEIDEDAKNRKFDVIEEGKFSDILKIVM